MGVRLKTGRENPSDVQYLKNVRNLHYLPDMWEVSKILDTEKGAS